MFVSKKLGRIIAAMCALVLSMGTMWAQNLNVSGRVTDQQGEPIVGAYVLIEGTKTGTTTDINGAYKLSAPTKGVLLFNCMGYKDLQVPVNGRAIIDVIMEDDALMLQETVVVGFGTQKKVNLTGSVATVDVDKTFGSKPITDISKGLQGTVPGLSITYSTNDLNSSPTMSIRGTGSVNTVNGQTAPLILLDGVEVPDLSFVNPDNVKSISVLKDAASASIYGSRAAWGVVLITSKDGSGSKDRATVTYSNNFSWNTPQALPQYITTKEGVLAQLEEGIIAQKNVDGSRIEAFGMYYDSMSEGISRWFDKYYDNLSNPVYTYGEDYEYIGGTAYHWRVSDPNKELFKTSLNQMHNLGINGNAGKTNYNISLGYSTNEGTLKMAENNNVKRYNANISTNSQVKPWLNIGTKVMYVEKNYEYPYGYEASNGTMGLLYYTMRFPAFFPFGISDGAKLPDGSYYSAATQASEGLYFKHGNGWLVGETPCYTDDQYLSIGGNIKINIAEGLTFYGDYTRGKYNYENRTMRQPYYTTSWLTPTKSTATTNDFLRRTFRSRVTNTFNAYFDYLFDFNKEHNFAVKVGANGEDLTYNQQYISVNGVQNVAFPILSLTNGNKEAEVSEELRHRATAGFFGRINYNYKDKILLELNGRYDGSSSFRPGKQWAFFGSASAGYKISEEAFWENIKPIVNTLKIRGSYGSVGNQALSSWYPYISTMSVFNTSWVGQDMVFASSTTTPKAVNDSMTWEKIRTLDIGFDAGFLNNELTVVFDWFRRENIGMLVAGDPIVRYVGISTAPLQNSGNLLSTGWELQLDYNHAFNKNVAVYGTFTISDAKAKITKWEDNSGTLTGNYLGKEFGEIWGFKTDRYFTKDDFNADGSLKAGIPTQSKIESGSFRFSPGDIKYQDLNGDGEISTGKGTIEDHGDLVRIGNALPRYEYSLRAGAYLYGFDVEFLLQGVGKREMWTSSSLFIPHNAGAQMNIYEYQLDYWTESNPNARYPRPYIHPGGNLPGLPSQSGQCNFAPQTKYMSSLAYLRLKNVTVGYTLPEKLTKKINIDKVRVYFSGQNLLTFDRINGIMDPELTGGWSSPGGNTPNNIDTQYAGRAVPFNRQLSCGIQLTF